MAQQLRINSPSRARRAPGGRLAECLPSTSAGTGHQCLSAEEDFLVVGTYPPTGTYDECTKVEDRPKALKTITKVASPRQDPVYGADGPLLMLWKPK
jgi:uncharacterized protein YjlB